MRGYPTSNPPHHSDSTTLSKEFVKYFDAELPKSVEQFDAVMASFLEVAHVAHQAHQERLQREQEAKRYREARLREVFEIFDYKGKDRITKEELFELGVARRSKGHKGGTWTEEKNTAMILKMDVDGDGEIHEAEFVTFFDRELPQDLAHFDETIEEFLEAAQHIAEAEKEAERREVEFAAHRVAMLEKVFEEFDWNASGHITSQDVFLLGVARRSHGHKGGTWTQEKNDKLVHQMDADGDGEASRSLPQPQPETRTRNRMRLGDY